MNWYHLNGLKALRKEKNVNQKEMAIYLNLSQNSISQYEIGERLPKVEVIRKLLNFFDAHIWELLGLTLEDFRSKNKLYLEKGFLFETQEIMDEYIKIAMEDQVYQDYQISNKVPDQKSLGEFSTDELIEELHRRCK